MLFSPPKSAVWTCLFLNAPGPGQVFRFLERRLALTPQKRADLATLDLLLSDAVVGATRALLVGRSDAARDWAQEHAPLFAAAFPPPVTLVFADTQQWGWRVWEETGAGDLFTEAVTFASSPSLWTRFLGGRTPEDTPSARAERWARAKGLPLHRVPGLSRQQQRIPVLDYATVAALDQRGLLIEDGPRLYRFAFDDDAPPGSEEEATV